MSEQERIDALEKRVEDLTWFVGVIANQIAEPPTKSWPASDVGLSRRIVRPATRSELRADVQRIADRLGIDLDFRVI